MGQPRDRRAARDGPRLQPARPGRDAEAAAPEGRQPHLELVLCPLRRRRVLRRVRRGGHFCVLVRLRHLRRPHAGHLRGADVVGQVQGLAELQAQALPGHELRLRPVLLLRSGEGQGLDPLPHSFGGHRDAERFQRAVRGRFIGANAAMGKPLPDRRGRLLRFGARGDFVRPRPHQDIWRVPPHPTRLVPCVRLLCARCPHR
mmetsp:Transcript_8650/g.24399  ORF Transcript_8650/g.24399 Transcript_8650/m.24399 type:complete len:202 (-) Transcript_8650:162-767(-)